MEKVAPLTKQFPLFVLTFFEYSMYDLIKDFPEQLRKAIQIGEKATFKTAFASPVKNILVCGLGGSGIGGNLLSELLRDELKVPVAVNKGYFLPAFADESTLVLLCSYSGNTEETISCARQCVEKGLKAVCITSGGELAAIAEENKFDVITIPGGFPPRSCLGYALLQLFFAVQAFGLISDAFKNIILQVADFLDAEQKAMMESAEALAPKLLQKAIIVYAEDKYESVALRIKQQVNENSKLPCWYSAIPEMNHNELVGWREANNALGVLILRTEDEYERNTARINFSREVIQKVSDNVNEIKAKGNNVFEKHFYLIHFGDWLSYYLAVKEGYDPSEIDVLIRLKNHMSAL